MRKICLLLLSLALMGMGPWKDTLVETPVLADAVEDGTLPPIAERLPEEPLIVDLEKKGRDTGVQGGSLRTMVSRSKDVRQMVVYGYARLVGYDETYALKPDLLAGIEIDRDRRFVMRLREGHKWSDGQPFTSADFEYWWTKVANHPEVSPNGPPDFLRINDKLPRVSFPDPLTVVYEWDDPNPYFVQRLAAASPAFIYRPAHYLKQFHYDFADPDALIAAVKAGRVKSWAALHNSLDNMYKFDNPDLPTLQPWRSAGDQMGSRRVYVRNPFYHRIDATGQQLPYIDQVEMFIVASGLVAAKANAGEVDLQGRGLSFRDISILKKGEADGGNYDTYLWASGVASQIAIYPNLNFADPVWRDVIRDVRFRRALSIGIDRRMINRVLYFGLGTEGGMTALSKSPLFQVANLTAWSIYDLERANQLLDEMGLEARAPNGTRLLPDGRPMNFVVETAGEAQEVENALQIIDDTWRDIGINLVIRTTDRDILRNRVNSGSAMAAVWYGWDNGLPTPTTPPNYLAPRSQGFFAWPKWGQYFETAGNAGEEPDMPGPVRLLELSRYWENARSDAERRAIWLDMLAIHADQQYGIGIVTEAPQPIVVSKRLRNVPEGAKWAWDPGAHFGVHRVDEFYFSDEARP